MIQRREKEVGLEVRRGRERITIQGGAGVGIEEGEIEIDMMIGAGEKGTKVGMMTEIETVAAEVAVVMIITDQEDR